MHIVWTFNAKHDDREEIIQSCIVDEEGSSYDVVMTRAIKTRRVQSKSTPLRNPKRMFLNLENSWQNSRPAAAPSIAANDKEQETEIWDHEEDEANLEWNGPRDSAPVPGDQLQPQLFLIENIPEKWNIGGILMRNPGQGDCLFHALVQALAVKEPGKKRSHRQLRAFTVATMKNKAPVYEKKKGQNRFQRNGYQDVFSWICGFNCSSGHLVWKTWGPGASWSFADAFFGAYFLGWGIRY